MDYKKGNAMLKYPIGLITADESVFAGFNTYSGNTNDYKDEDNYLFNNYDYWTFSPLCFNDGNISFIMRICKDGSLGNYDTHYVQGVRPVISLKSGTVIEPTGEGTTTNPYIVK